MQPASPDKDIVSTALGISLLSLSLPTGERLARIETGQRTESEEEQARGRDNW